MYARPLFRRFDNGNYPVLVYEPHYVCLGMGGLALFHLLGVFVRFFLEIRARILALPRTRASRNHARKRRLPDPKSRHAARRNAAFFYHAPSFYALFFRPRYVATRLFYTWFLSSRLPDKATFKRVMLTTCHQEDLKLLPNDETGYERKSVRFRVSEGLGVKLFHGSNVFINGQGSGGKAALALKIAIAPSYSHITSGAPLNRVERVLIISFLYPQEYYDSIHLRLQRLRSDECGLEAGAFKSRIEVLHLYPGYLKPDTLFSKIEWTLRAAELDGDPFTTIILDGIHNVFIQFPEIEKQTLFWPQLFSMLRTKNLFTIITHTLLSVKEAPFDMRGHDDGRYRSVDDSRSDPLRHALVQKTDFRLEVDPVTTSSGGAGISEQHAFMVETYSAIGQSLPDRSARLYWSRERLVLFEERQSAFL